MRVQYMDTVQIFWPHNTIDSGLVEFSFFTSQPEKIATLIKLFEKRSADELYLNVGSGGAHLAVAAPAVASSGLGGAALAAAVEEKKEETKEESDDDMGLSLFD
ncbi:hypothetical protein CUMW_143270 [Citrus unshiu]|uniref:Uncharacterized protein n=1 Tax=Citrus sinensis TaxID=2711 RepID=A0A067DRV3_CITSI|nr:hypothetical protein CISIN_1g044925mg [Citrus sinensis]GAY52623.1 hypothetical protein CUMW_143270 [Citrus unshiu]